MEHDLNETPIYISSIGDNLKPYMYLNHCTVTVNWHLHQDIVVLLLKISQTGLSCIFVISTHVCVEDSKFRDVRIQMLPTKLSNYLFLKENKPFIFNATL